MAWDGIEQCGAELDNVALGLEGGDVRVSPDFLRRVASYVRELEKRVSDLEADLEISERSGGFGV